jgi:Zn-dependent oligopeptidase
MANELPDDAGLRLRELREQFIVRMTGDAQKIRALAESMESDGTDNAVLALGRLCHALCGTASLFGFASVSDASALVQQAVREVPPDLGRISRQSIFLADHILHCAAAATGQGARQ